jgi:hypothetical protein
MYAMVGMRWQAYHSQQASLQAYVSHHYHGKHARHVVAGHVATRTYLLQS